MAYDYVQNKTDSQQVSRSDVDDHKYDLISDRRLKTNYLQNCSVVWSGRASSYCRTSK